MFEDSGGKLKKIVNVLFIIEVICIILWTILSLKIYSFFAIIFGALLIFSGYVTALFFCAIGEIAENTSDAAYNTQAMRKKQEKRPKATVASVATGGKTAYFDTRADNKYYSCPICSTVQRGNLDKCEKCGTKFLYRDEINEEQKQEQ